MEIIIIILLIGIVALTLIKGKGKNNTKSTNDEQNTKQDILENETYHKKEIFSKAELNFYKVCKLIADENELSIFPKMTLKEFLYVQDEQGRKNPYKYFSKIDKKHIDFTLYDPKTNEIILCIELDDSSHKKEDRIKRDKYVDEVMKMAGIRLVRIPAKQSYNVNEIKDAINYNGYDNNSSM